MDVLRSYIRWLMIKIFGKIGFKASIVERLLNLAWQGLLFGVDVRSIVSLGSCSERKKTGC